MHTTNSTLFKYKEICRLNRHTIPCPRGARTDIDMSHIKSTSTYDAIIIGGGLAGAGTARALAQRGRKVLLCETHPHLAAKASGNARGLLMPYVATHSSPPGRLYAKGFRYTHTLLTDTFGDQRLYTECGAMQLPATKRLARILTETTECVGDVPIRRISSEEGSSVAGITVPTPSFFIPQAGFCKPVDVTHALVETGNALITIRCSHEAINLTSTKSTWRVTFRNGDIEETETVVLCGAHEIAKFSATSWIPLEAIRGQTAQAHSSQASASLQTVISYDGYITPEYNGVHFIGAHYRHNDVSEEPNDSDRTEILSRLYRTLPTISNLTVASSRVCFRASTHDRMPYIGVLPLQDTPQLFINAGHGSRGLLTAPLGGEIIARLMHSEALGHFEEAATISTAARLAKRYEATA